MVSGHIAEAFPPVKFKFIYIYLYIYTYSHLLIYIDILDRILPLSVEVHDAGGYVSYRLCGWGRVDCYVFLASDELHTSDGPFGTKIEDDQ
jgi:hypothetical protein